MKSRAVLPAIVFGLAASLAVAQTPQQEQKPGQPTPQTPAQKQTMQKGGQADTQKLRDEYIAAWSKGDARALAMLYTENAIFVNAMGEVMAGRQQIQQATEKDMAGPMKGTKLTVKPGRQQSIRDDVMVEEGRYQVTGGQATGAGQTPGGQAKAAGPPPEGQYVITLVRMEGQWRIAGHASLVPHREMAGQKPMQ
jgi:uncharacterized protein (TIGR02246 family)